MADPVHYAVCFPCAQVVRGVGSASLTSRQMLAGVQGLAAIEDAHPGCATVLLPAEPQHSWSACECCDNPTPGLRYPLRIAPKPTRH